MTAKLRHRGGRLLLCFVLFLRLSAILDALHQCAVEKGGGVCPTGNTCCRILTPHDGAVQSGCIPNDLGSYNATCCPGSLTGCGVGYICSEKRLPGSKNESTCIAGPLVTDPLVQVLPRYSLCSVSQELRQLHGFPIFEAAKLPYYSSHGDVTQGLSRQDIRVLLVVIHGAGRDADEYYSAMKSAVLLQGRFSSKSVLLIAPRFPLLGDADLDYPDNTDGSINSSTSLRWDDTDLQGGGGWRYGSESVAPTVARGVSSFTALDYMIGNITMQLESLDRVIFAGHSSGGQFVQRYALLTPVWKDSFRAFVANPSSFAYLWPLRYSKGDKSWYYPNSSDCPGYNEWEWGLEIGGNDKAPYFQNTVREFGVAFLVRRFARRLVFYAAGSLDVCNMSSHQLIDSGWCDSHGLETTCNDMLEGGNRWERHQNYVASLQWIHHAGRHQSVVVQGVGHDHSLMFQSQQGIEAMFGSHTDKAVQ